DGYFNTGLFADTACPPTVNQGLWCEGVAGQTGRNALYGPGYSNVDLGIAKRFKIKETAALQFQANFFNLLNRANFVIPIGNLTDSNFGKSTATFLPGQGGARVTQLALRFDF